ncbi:MPN domain-containing protein [Haematococcus lacustris]|uniref:MPN domain-containing protein n=2 Tax=Haematococcus lacustris TaxID=44745 RepID=A0A699YGN8_HAELA|nr:MPN domain-containing protein [Haematococcus lacustris]
MPSTPDKVVLHPLVLLSVVDHYNRVARDTRKRVLGVLLGDVHKGTVDVSNSFAVPFEEDDHDPTIWFLDHSYLEVMYKMFKKVNAREKVVGWYSTGPKIREADLAINALLAKFADWEPVMVICEVQDGTEKAQKVFVSVPTEVGQTEAEEIGVEHLLRDVKDATVTTLSTDVTDKLLALKGLTSRLHEIRDYLQAVLDGRLPVNHDISEHLQHVFNLLPNMNAELLSRSLSVKSNDMMLTIYLAALIRSVLALHKLIDNKEQRMWQEREAQAAKDTKTAVVGTDKGSKEGDKDATKDKESSKDSKDSKASEQGRADGAKPPGP